MADLKSTVELIFNGTNLVGGTVNSVLRDIDRLNTGIQRAIQPIGLLTAGILAAEAAAARFAFTFAKDAFDASIDFSRAQVDLQKVMSDSEASVDSYTPRVIALSNEFGITAANVLQAAADFRKAGFDTKGAFDVLEEALIGAIAGEIELTEISTKLRRVMAGLQVDTLNTADAMAFTKRTLDLVNAASDNTGSNFDAILDGLARFSPIAGGANLALEDTVAVVTAVTNVFGDGEIAGRALTTIFNRLVSENGNVRDALKQLEVSQFDANQQLKSGEQIFFEVVAAMDKVTDSQKALIVQQIAGSDQSGKLRAVFDGLAKVQEIVYDRTITLDSALKEATRVLEGAGKAVDRTQVSYINLQAAIGKELQDSIIGLLNGFTNINGTLEELARNGGLDKFLDVVTPQIDEFARLANQVADALPQALQDADYSGFAAGIEVLFGDLKSINITADDVAGAITALGETFESLARFTEAVISAFTGLANVFGPIIKSYTDLDSGTQEIIATSIAATAVIAALGSVLGGLVTVGRGAAGAVISLASGMASLAGGVAGLPAALAGASGALGTFRGAIGAAAGATGVGLLTYELGRWADLNDIIINDDLAGYENASIGSIFADIADWIFGSGTSIEGTYKRVGDASTDMAEKATRAFDQIENSASGMDVVSNSLDIASINAQNAALAYERLGGTAQLTDQILTAAEFLPSLDPAPLDNFIEKIDETGKVTRITFDGIGQAANDGAAAVQVGTKKATEASEEYRLKMLEIASDERIKIIEAAFQFDIAKLEADTKQIEAAFASIDTTIESTGDLIGSLFGELSGLGRFDQLAVFDQIAKEDRRRQQALDLQRDLIEAQIAKINAQTSALRQGNALIKVDASPLAPHLQTILHEILKQIQLKASADMMEFLLNVDPSKKAA